MLRLTIAFALFAILFTVLEHRNRGAIGRNRFRPGFWLDVAYWFFTPTVTQGITKLVLALPIFWLAQGLGVSLEALRDRTYSGFGPLSQQPIAMQALQVLILADFLNFWMHRLFHQQRHLWPFHAVHHSSVSLDWLSSVRLHPVNDALSTLVVVILLMPLGYNPFVLSSYAPLLALYGLMLHANVNWNFGPLRYVITSPTFHRWHHSKEPKAYHKNFAGLFPLWDIIFGTFYLPEKQHPEYFGIHESIPNNLPGQLVFPFRSRKPGA